MLIGAALITFLLTAITSMVGVGAAFLLVPIFLALGIEIHTAMATALLLNAISTGVSTTTYVRRHLVEWRLAVPILIVAMILSPFGVDVGQGLNRSLLLWLFAAFLIFAGLMMLCYTPRARNAARSARQQLLSGSILGAVAGFVGGLLGVGGGSMIVPALVGSGVEPRRASATTAFVVVFASLTAFVAHTAYSGIDYSLAGATGIAAAAGGALGSWLMSEKLKARQLKYLFGLILLGTAIKIIWGLL